MDKLTRLKFEARNSAKARGHNLTKFSTYWDGKSAQAMCEKCKAIVTVNTAPKPNEIEIGGTAVALNCVSGSVVISRGDLLRATAAIYNWADKMGFEDDPQYQRILKAFQIVLDATNNGDSLKLEVLK